MQTIKSNTKKAKSSSNTAQDLQELFEEQLKDLYWAEKALTKALPKMAKKATSDELKKALNNHLTETEKHVKRLEEVFELIEKPSRAKKCEAMEGLIKEGEEIIESTEEGPVRDAGIIAACQKVEHYEIASYGTLKTFATILDKNKIAAMLGKTLEEEKLADSKLTEVAENSINVEAAEAE